MDRHTTAHLYAVAVLAAFDAIRNCSYCRRNTSEDNCEAWREARNSVAVLAKQARRLAKGVGELRHATGGRTANIYEFSCGSVAYFAPDAPDFQEAEELRMQTLPRPSVSSMPGRGRRKGELAKSVPERQVSSI